MHHSALIEDLAVILCIAAVVIVLFQKIKQPTVLGYLIAGIIIGPYTPPFSFIDDETDIRILAELGVIFLMFSLGLEFSCRKLVKVGLSALFIGFFEVLVMVAVGFFTGKFLGWSQHESFLLGAALSISSTTIIIKELEEFNLKKEFFAELMVGVLLIEDLLAILLMVVVSASNPDESLLSFPVLKESVKLFAIIVSAFLAGYFAVPYLMRLIQKYITHESLTIISIGLCLFLSSMAVYFNYSAALGGFIMGSILAESPQVKRIEALTLPVRDMFAAVFFVSVGMLIDPKAILEYLPVIVIFSLVTIIGKILTSSIGALISGQHLDTSLKIGFGMAQIGEFSFIIVGIGGMMAATDASLYPIIVAIAAITTFATPYLIKFSLRFHESMEKKLPEAIQSLLRSYRELLKKFQRSRHILKGGNPIRFFILALLVAVLWTFVIRLLTTYMPWQSSISEPIYILTALAAASPFIWGMLFADASKEIGAQKILFWILTFSELALLVFSYLSSSQLLLPIVVAALIFFVASYSLLQETYLFFETTLINNLTKREVLSKIMPTDFSLVKLKACEWQLKGKTLEDCKLGSKYGIYVIAIQHGKNIAWLPEQQQPVFIDDELVLFGDSEEMEQFSDLVKRHRASHDNLH